MICSENKDLMVVALVGKLTPSQRQTLEKHLLECPECLRQYENMKKYEGLRAKKEFHLPDWNNSWRTIKKGLKVQRTRSSFLGLSLRLSYSLAAIFVIFIIGFFIGKRFFPQKPREFAYAQPKDQITALSITAYAERVDSLLIHWINRNEEQMTETMRKLEQEAIEDILVQTRILKHMYTQMGKTYLLHLIEDMELILVSISNLRPDDEEYALQLAQLIHEKALLFHLRQLVKDTSTLSRWRAGK